MTMKCLKKEIFTNIHTIKDKRSYKKFNKLNFYKEKKI